MTSAIAELPPLRDLIREHDLRASKTLGQNFLLDLNLTARIAEVAGSLERCDIIEIGPGPGGLTRALLNAGARHVFAVERDHRCVEATKTLVDASGSRLTVIEGDALEIDVNGLGTGPRKIISNLPYNISTALLLKWLHDLRGIQQMTLMFQKEVADRLTASPGTKAYGRLSVLTQWLCDVRQEFTVSPKAFTPPPKVTSAIVNLTPRIVPISAASMQTLEAVTAAAFGQRRKMLRASLKSLNPNFKDIGIDPTQRAENLSIAEFCLIANALDAQRH